MHDSTYCYPDTEVLINKLNIIDPHVLFDAEKELTFIRLQELQQNPVKGNFDFSHLSNIHKYIFQDIYEWAGEIRTVEIGKGNLFCTTFCIPEYGKYVFEHFYPECFGSKDNKLLFRKTLARNYADLNALHPFREGNGRTQREFTRLVCIECGYIFDLSYTTHEEMLSASKLSFNTGDTIELEKIFDKTVIPLDEYHTHADEFLKVLTSDDMTIASQSGYYDYYSNDNIELIDRYTEIYQNKIKQSASLYPTFDILQI